jgi:thiamine-phosphate pyrophosphorylase
VTRLALVHAVTDDRVLALPDFFDRARALARGPWVAIHLRGRLAGGPLLRLAERLRGLTAETGAQLLVHDRADVARLCGADGTHLPEGGLPVSRTRELLPAGALVGRSVHAPADADIAAAEGADYVFLGSIWETASHPGRPPLGPGAITASTAGRVIAIGGITPATAQEAVRAGAAGVAAIRALWDAADPGAAADALRVSCSG